MIRSTRLTVAALAAWSLTVLVQAPADAAAPDLPRPAHGSDAIALLGDDLAAAAEANGQSPAELRRILRQDPTAWLDRDARMFYVEPTDRGAPTLAEGVAPFPLDQTFLLHSKPLAQRDLPRLRRRTVERHGLERRLPSRRYPGSPPGTSHVRQRRAGPVQPSGSRSPRTTRLSTSTSPPRTPAPRIPHERGRPGLRHPA